MDDLIDGEGTADRAYRWTVRGLYALAIILNVWLLWDAVKDNPEAAELKSQLARMKNRAMHPFQLEQVIQRETGPMIWEAMQIVEEANNG